MSERPETKEEEDWATEFTENTERRKGGREV
jgi:hypothetical protein